MSICQVIGELLNEKKGVQIDLQYIGKFFGKYRVIRFDTQAKFKEKIVKERDNGKLAVNSCMLYFGVNLFKDGDSSRYYTPKYGN